ncbi:hypothetical protein N7462_000048 [Penicillium macrosclerotiorum]|uniref:uncharacterized protein n=1 Tax=Penicillium macrosclerotiorum TaxID=303699 RepID=UPI002546F724|nr:uncharacterized protein N7462_000048 [Penicillium macrosclerotiorum]KAJ5698043.1 hypothetical protein N7462_000048 [Penicillium macrosclerotiorum]
MKALVYTGPGTVEVQDRPKPTIQTPTDAVVRLLHASICGTDLHILKGDVPGVKPGLVLGHEGVGVVDAVGAAVTTHHVGDRAEFVRVPHATLSLHSLSLAIDPHHAVALSDALPTGLECGVLSANIQPGCSVLIVGAGPVGLATLLAARLYTPALIVVIDLDETRLLTARRLGAHATILSTVPDARQRLLDLTRGDGFDAVVEAVGVPETFGLCQEVVAVGGRIANVGVHGTKVDLHLEKLWDRNISIHMSLVNATTTSRLLRLVESGQLDIGSLVTHHFPSVEGATAYTTFQAAAQHQALKVAIDF